MFLQLPKAGAGFTVAFRGIHDTATRDTLAPGGEGEDPAESNYRGDGKQTIEVAEHRSR